MLSLPDSVELVLEVRLVHTDLKWKADRKIILLDDRLRSVGIVKKIVNDYPPVLSNRVRYRTATVIDTRSLFSTLAETHRLMIISTRPLRCDGR